MSMQDPVADLLTRIRNGQMARKKSVTMPSSSLKQALVKVLQDEGYVAAFDVAKDGSKANLTVELRYYEDKPVIKRIKRVSRPGLRIYKSKSELPIVSGGLGIAIVSTPNGVMTAKSASHQGLGGEVLCTVE